MVAQGFQDIITPGEYAEAAALLQQSGLDMPEGIDAGIGLREDGRLVGTAFLAGNTICGVCVSNDHRGQGTSASLVGRMLTTALAGGATRVNIFTKSAEADKFAALGFRLVAATDDSAMLEFGTPDYTEWIRETQKRLAEATAENTSAHGSAQGTTPATGSIVMNANPFTLGHRALVEKAAACCHRVAVFVVEEDASVFPFAERLTLVRRGTADLPGVAVLPAGPYMVSRASFPAYFSGKAAHAAVHARLDAQIFATRIAPDLGITIRFVGTEPYCAATATYNETLHAVLPAHGITLREIPRRTGGDESISASKVRELLRDENYATRIPELSQLVPPSTLAFLLSGKGQAIAARLRHRTGRH